MTDSLPPKYFEKLYQENPDPWGFATSDYEAKKYAATLAALSKPHYAKGFEIGGSIGVLTAQLAQRCGSLLSIDVCETAQKQAIERCQDLSHVRFEIMQVPQAYPNEMFDLTVLSEVGYYLSWDDLARTQQLMIEHLKPGGHLLLVHWTPKAQSYPLTGDEVHDSFIKRCGSELRHLNGLREEQYRLDLFERI